MIRKLVAFLRHLFHMVNGERTRYAHNHRRVCRRWLYAHRVLLPSMPYDDAEVASCRNKATRTHVKQKLGVAPQPHRATAYLQPRA